MIYKIRQVTKATVTATVPFARHLLRLTPVSRPGQVVLSSETTIEPAVYERRVFARLLRQPCHARRHRDTASVVRGAVAVRSSRVASFASGRGDYAALGRSTRGGRAMAQSRARIRPAHFIFASRYVPLEPAIRDYAAESFPEGRPILEAGVELMNRIRDDFAYDPAATETTTPIAEAFAMRHGVCQDFAHVMISGLRGLGLPAAYVSGYLRTMPPPSQPRLEGADATHAWVSLWCGPQHGWQGLDPTNALRTARDHIVLAVGRDFADVSPLDGVILVGGGHTHSVAVDVIPRDELAGTNPEPGVTAGRKGLARWRRFWAYGAAATSAENSFAALVCLGPVAQLDRASVS